MFFTFILIVFIHSITITHISSYEQPNDYCDVSTCPRGGQTMCLFPDNDGPSYRCDQAIYAGFSDEEIDAILRWHNSIRKKIADGEETQGISGGPPPASNMRTLRWDDELASVAQRWADQCLPGHDHCRNVERFPVIQNVATLWNTDSLENCPVDDLMVMWYDEVSNFDRRGVPEYSFDSSTGHYTQLIWAETNLIGCGRVLYFDQSTQMNCVRLVCNYGSGGNFIGQPIYKIGEPASECSYGVNWQIPGLCN